MSSTCVVGLQWGDEAKGKLVDLLTSQHQIVVRFQGGANAGHTVVSGGNTYKLSLIPTGILNPDVVSVIGNGLVIDPIRCLAEIDSLSEAGVSIGSNLMISDRAHVIFPYHKKEEEVSETAAGKDAIGTTMRGIGPCYREKLGRSNAIRMGELIDPNQLKERLKTVCEFKNRIYCSLDPSFQGFDASALFDEYSGYGERLKPHVGDTTAFLHESMAEKKSMLFEGAQGALLDVDHGTFPFVTSSNSSVCGLASGSGVPARYVDHFLGVVKAYTTRVGGGPFPTELENAIGERIRERGREFGTVTGRPRRVGWFDSMLVNYTAKISGVDSLAVMLLDVLSGPGELEICVGYRLNGKKLTSVPASVKDLERIEPIMESVPGWQEEITHCRQESELPDAARRYVERISNLVGLPISFVSIGPDREQTIDLR